MPEVSQMLKQIISLVHEAIIYDNSGPEPRLILEIRYGRAVSKVSELPRWARELLEGVRL